MLGYARILNTTRGDLYENPLQVGELVKLKSGGPVMTVSELDAPGGLIAVLWHDQYGLVQSATFAPELLQRSKRSFFFRRR